MESYNICFIVLLCCNSLIIIFWSLIHVVGIRSWSASLWLNYVLLYVYAAAAKSLQSCPTLCDPKGGSPPGSPIPGIFQARTLEWGAIFFSNAWKWKVKVKLLSHVQLLVTPLTAAYQATPSMGFSRQEYWSGLPLPSPCMYIMYFIYPFICLWILELLLPLVIVKMVQWSLIY